MKRVATTNGDAILHWIPAYAASLRGRCSFKHLDTLQIIRQYARIFLMPHGRKVSVNILLQNIEIRWNFIAVMPLLKYRFDLVFGGFLRHK